MNKLNIELHNSRNFTRDQRIKLYRALHLCVKTVNHPLFKQEVLSIKWYDKKNKVWIYRYHYTSDSNREIYNNFMSGKDIYNVGVEDNDIDVDITAYYNNNNVIGYTYPQTIRTWINMKFFNKWGLSNIVGNIIHENMHNIGYQHEYNWTYERQYSVPYMYGYIARDIAKEIQKGNI